MTFDKNIIDKIPCDKKLYFFGGISDNRQFGNEMFSCQVASTRDYRSNECYLLWDNPISLLKVNESMLLFGLYPKCKIDAASFICLLWYSIHKFDGHHLETQKAVLNPEADFFTASGGKEQRFFPQNTKSVFPYIEKHLENISGQQIDIDKRGELLKRIEDDNFLPPKVVLRYFPFWEETKSEEYVYSIINTRIRCEDKEFIEVTFLRERNGRLQAIELLGSPESCSKCGDDNWCFISLSSNKKAAKWKCNFCNSTLMLRADSPKDEKSSNGSKRKSISKDVKMAVWRRDNGKCVECGSKEKLEYDHIIPVSKGGSNTERNVQLLCETCNRKKSAKTE